MTITDVNGSIHGSDGQYKTKGQSEPDVTLGPPAVEPALSLRELSVISFEANEDFVSALADLQRAEKVEIEMALAHLDSIDNLEALTYRIEKTSTNDLDVTYHAEVVGLSTRNGYDFDTLVGDNGHEVKHETRKILNRLHSATVMQEMFDKQNLHLGDISITADYSRQPQHLVDYDKEGAAQRCQASAARAVNADRARLATSMSRDGIVEIHLTVDSGDGVNSADEYHFNKIMVETQSGTCDAARLSQNEYDTYNDYLDQHVDGSLGKRTRSHIDRIKGGITVRAEHASYDGQDW